MSWLDGLRHRFYVLTRGESYAQEVAREMSFHRELDHLSRSDTASELNPKSFGNTTYYREEVRSVSVLSWIDRFRQDAVYAWRGFRRTPAFTATVVATLGLGIGVNAAMFSFVDHVFFRAPVGVVDPDDVRRLYIRMPRNVTATANGIFGNFNYARFSAVEQRIGDSIPLAIYTPSSGKILRVESTVDSSRISFVSTNYFSILGVRPALGRLFAPEEQSLDNPVAVAVISDALWRRVFSADPAALGRTFQLNKRRFTIVGVAPPGFSGLDMNLAEVWSPLPALDVAGRNGQPWYRSNYGNFFSAIARVPSNTVEARVSSAGTAALRTVRDYGRDPDTTLSLLTGSIVQARGPAQIDPAIHVSSRVAGLAFLVLIIACANVANMLLLRATSRRREIAVRRALGGSRARLFGQVLTESTLLGLMSGGMALLFALWAGRAVRQLVLPTVHWSAAAIDLRVAAMVTAIAFAVGFAAGLFPAAFANGIDLSDGLKAGAPHQRTRKNRSQAALLVLQTALSVVLLVAAGLFARSLSNVRGIDLGYDPNGLVTVTTWENEDAPRNVSAELPLILERLRGMPGVVAASLSQAAPMTGWGGGPVFLPGRDSMLFVGNDIPTSLRVGPGFFAASGVRLIAGRDFTNEDRLGAQAVVVVDERIAQSQWPGENPLGKCVLVGKRDAGCSAVIGVVESVHRSRVIEGGAAQYYMPLGQSRDPGTAIVARVTSGHEASVAAALRAELRPLFYNQSAFVVRTLHDVTANELRPWRMGAILFAALGVLAVVVAAIGVYGVVAYATAQRTHEMGVRIALGAEPRQILDLVLATNARVVVSGIVIGVIASLMLGRLVASLLFGVVPGDPSVIIGAIVTMCIVAGVASAVPGWRATRVNPVDALRHD